MQCSATAGDELTTVISSATENEPEISAGADSPHEEAETDGATLSHQTHEVPFTLPRVVEMVRGHAEALRGIAQSLHDVGDHFTFTDPDVTDVGALRALLAVTRERADAAATELLEIDGRAGQDGSLDLDAVWTSIDVDEGLRLCLDTLPPLVLAAEAALVDPDSVLASGSRWYWVHSEAERISRDLHAWVKAQEKEVAHV